MRPTNGHPSAGRVRQWTANPATPHRRNRETTGMPTSNTRQEGRVSIHTQLVEWPVVTAKCGTSLYHGWSAWPVTFGVEGDKGHHGGDGREIGYLSGGRRDPDVPAWRDRHPGEEPMTRLWLRLNPDELAKLPGVAEAVDRMRDEAGR